MSLLIFVTCIFHQTSSMSNNSLFPDVSPPLLWQGQKGTPRYQFLWGCDVKTAGLGWFWRSKRAYYWSVLLLCNWFPIGWSFAPQWSTPTKGLQLLLGSDHRLDQSSAFQLKSRCVQWWRIYVKAIKRGHSTVWLMAEEDRNTSKNWIAGMIVV